MQTRVLFKDFEELPHLRRFVNETAEQIIGKFDHNRELKVRVIVGTVPRNGAERKPAFKCEVLVRGASLNKLLVAKNQNEDFENAVRGGFRIAEKILRRLYDKKVSLRKRETFKYVEAV